MALHREVERYGSALVPDFAEFYHLSLVTCLETMDPVEVVLLISGLPPTSRYVGRLMGESSDTGWGPQEWLALDMRNAVEGLRSTVTQTLAGKGKGGKFREWSVYPGQEQERLRKQEQAMDKLRAMAWGTSKR